MIPGHCTKICRCFEDVLISQAWDMCVLTYYIDMASLKPDYFNWLDSSVQGSMKYCLLMNSFVSADYISDY